MFPREVSKAVGITKLLDPEPAVAICAEAEADAVGVRMARMRMKIRVEYERRPQSGRSWVRHELRSAILSSQAFL